MHTTETKEIRTDGEGVTVSWTVTRLGCGGEPCVAGIKEDDREDG